MWCLLSALNLTPSKRSASAACNCRLEAALKIVYSPICSDMSYTSESYEHSFPGIAGQSPHQRDPRSQVDETGRTCVGWYGVICSYLPSVWTGEETHAHPSDERQNALPREPSPHSVRSLISRASSKTSETGSRLKLSKHVTEHFLCGHTLWNQMAAVYKIDCNFLHSARDDNLVIGCLNPRSTPIMEVIIQNVRSPGGTLKARQAILTYSYHHLKDPSQANAQPLAICRPGAGADYYPLEILNRHGELWGTLEMEDEYSWLAKRHGRVALILTGVPIDVFKMFREIDGTMHKTGAFSNIRVCVLNADGELMACMHSQLESLDPYSNAWFFGVNMGAGVDLCLILLSLMSSLLLRKPEGQ